MLRFRRLFVSAVGLLFIGLLSVTAAAEDQGVAVETVPYELRTDIVYASPNGRDLLLDAYLPEGDGPFPAVLVVHGGAWKSGNRKQLGFYALRLAGMGFSCFAIDYRLAPEFTFPAQIDDCRAAVRWIRSNADDFKVIPDRLGAIGYSAGGHLVSLLATSGGEETAKHKDQPSLRLQAVCAGGAPCEFQRMPHKVFVVESWLGGSIEDVPDRYRDASPTTFVSKNDPPVFFFNGTADQIVPLTWTQPLVKALTESGVQTELHTIDGAGHIDAASDKVALAKAFGFLRQHLQPETVATPSAVGDSPSSNRTP